MVSAASSSSPIYTLNERRFPNESEAHKVAIAARSGFHFLKHLSYIEDPKAAKEEFKTFVDKRVITLLKEHNPGRKISEILEQNKEEFKTDWKEAKETLDVTDLDIEKLFMGTDLVIVEKEVSEEFREQNPNVVTEKEYSQIKDLFCRLRQISKFESPKTELFILKQFARILSREEGRKLIEELIKYHITTNRKKMFFERGATSETLVRRGRVTIGKNFFKDTMIIAKDGLQLKSYLPPSHLLLMHEITHIRNEAFRNSRYFFKLSEEEQKKHCVIEMFKQNKGPFTDREEMITIARERNYSGEYDLPKRYTHRSGPNELERHYAEVVFSVKNLGKAEGLFEKLDLQDGLQLSPFQFLLEEGEEGKIIDFLRDRYACDPDSFRELCVDMMVDGYLIKQEEYIFSIIKEFLEELNLSSEEDAGAWTLRGIAKTLVQEEIIRMKMLGHGF